MMPERTASEQPRLASVASSSSDAAGSWQRNRRASRQSRPYRISADRTISSPRYAACSSVPMEANGSLLQAVQMPSAACRTKLRVEGTERSVSVRSFMVLETFPAPPRWPSGSSNLKPFANEMVSSFALGLRAITSRVDRHTGIGIYFSVPPLIPGTSSGASRATIAQNSKAIGHRWGLILDFTNISKSEEDNFCWFFSDLLLISPPNAPSQYAATCPLKPAVNTIALTTCASQSWC